MTENFTIIKVGWLTNTIGYSDRREEIIHHVYCIANFLQTHDLTVRELMHSKDMIDDNFSICSDDLTEDGLTLMKRSYDPWLRKVDHGMNPEDVSLLEKTLDDIRRKEN